MTRMMDSNSPELNASSVAGASTNNSGVASAQPPELNVTQRSTETKRQDSKKTMERERPLDDIISEQFPSFDAESLIVRPFEDEGAQHANFEKGQLEQPHQSHLNGGKPRMYALLASNVLC